MIAALLLAFGAGPSGDLASLAHELKDPAEKTRRTALQELARDGSPAAWTLVIDALADPSPMVADEAQLVLAGLADPELRKELAGKRGLTSGELWIRRRTAEVLGRMQAPVDGQVLARALEDKDSETRHMAAWSIERAARGHALDARTAKPAASALLDALRHDKAPLVRAAALRALGACEGPDTHDFLHDAAAEVVCAALQREVELRGEAARPLLVESQHSALLPVRCEVALQLAGIRARSSVESLIEMLGSEGDARLSWTIAEGLTGLTGVRDERNVKAWSEWFARQPQDWQPGPLHAAAPRKAEADSETTHCEFVGLPVLSERLAILIDLSGSISKPRADGKTRKQVLDLELEHTLASFPHEARFNLIPYTGQPDPWQKQLVEASAANVAKALDFFRGLKDTGKGNVWDAFELALADPGVDTLLLFSDGAPTGGQRWNLELMSALFAERNRFRHVVLDAVIVDAKKHIQTAWRSMCESSGGRMLPVELK